MKACNIIIHFCAGVHSSHVSLHTLGRFATGQASAEEIKERQARSLAEPEIQAILKDPIMQQVLQDFQEDPRAAQRHLKNPAIMQKINKLVAAGIIQVGSQ